jgi:hypothetical protein
MISRTAAATTTTTTMCLMFGNVVGNMEKSSRTGGTPLLDKELTEFWYHSHKVRQLRDKPNHHHIHIVYCIYLCICAHTNINHPSVDTIV